MNRVRAIAFYLPQYHPIPENDTWWGPGFTEWANVARAQPLFRGHVQPKIPGALGFYDLRLPETRQAQADLAAEAGIEAFCYWHYWFGDGRMLLDRPFREVLQSGEPDFPFCLAWANASWNSASWNAVRWSPLAPVLQEQTYDRADIDRHFEHVRPAFEDPRYFRVDGKPLFHVQLAGDIPPDLGFAERWRELAERAGLGGIYLVADRGRFDPRDIGFDATVVFPPRFMDLHTGLRRKFDEGVRRLGRPPRVTLGEITDFLEHRPDPPWREHPMVITGWDNTPRRGPKGDLITLTAGEWSAHVEAAVRRVKDVPFEERLLFVRSWNEWGEGSYLEPDQESGTSMLDAFRAVVRADS